MNHSLIFSQIFGPLFIILGISMIINKKWFKKIIKEFFHSDLTIFVSGCFGFIFGCYILIHYTGFSNPHNIFATILGMIMTLKSTFLLLTPHVMKSFGKSFSPLTKNIHYIGNLYLLIGIYISYIAYID